MTFLCRSERPFFAPTIPASRWRNDLGTIPRGMISPMIRPTRRHGKSPCGERIGRSHGSFGFGSAAAVTTAVCRSISRLVLNAGLLDAPTARQESRKNNAPRARYLPRSQEKVSTSSPVRHESGTGKSRNGDIQWSHLLDGSRARGFWGQPAISELLYILLAVLCCWAVGISSLFGVLGDMRVRGPSSVVCAIRSLGVRRFPDTLSSRSKAAHKLDSELSVRRWRGKTEPTYRLSLRDTQDVPFVPTLPNFRAAFRRYWASESHTNVRPALAIVQLFAFTRPARGVPVLLPLPLLDSAACPRD